jgi:hypothetical protein
MFLKYEIIIQAKMFAQVNADRMAAPEVQGLTETRVIFYADIFLVDSVV